MHEDGNHPEQSARRAVAASDEERQGLTNANGAEEELRRLNDRLERKAQELERLNQTLIDSEQRLRLAISTGRIGLWVWNSTDVTNSGDWSPRLKEIFGLPLEAEVTHEMFLQCVHPEDRERVNGGVMQALAGANGGDYSCEYRAIHPGDGAQRWATARGQAFFDEAGQAVRFIGTVMDITDRKRAELSLSQLNIELEDRITQRLAELAQTNLALQNEIAERRHAEDELRRSERLLSEGQRISRTGSWAWNIKTGKLVWSAEQRNIFGLPSVAGEVTFDDFAEMIHPEDRPFALQTIEDAIRVRGPFDQEFRIVLSDGSVTYIHRSGRPVLHESGEMVEYIGAVMDITDRKRAESELRRSKAYLEHALELSHTGSVGFRVSERQLFWSSETARMYGYDPAIPPTREMVLARVHPDDLSLLEEAFERIEAGGANFDFKHRLLMPDGSIKYLHTLAHPVTDESGREEVLGALTDITEQVKAKASIEDAIAKLQKSEDQFRTIIDTIPTLVWSTRGDGAAEFFSQPWLDYTGLSKRQAQGQGWTVVIHPNDIGRLYDQWTKIISSKTAGEMEARLRRFDGEYRWFLFRASPLIDEQGNVVKWYGTNTDIEDRKRAEQALRRSKAYLEHAQKLSHTGSVGFRVSDGRIFWSEETARIYDYDPAIPPTMEMVLARVHPDDVAHLKEVFRQAAAGGASFDFEHRLLMPDGSIKYIANFSHSVKDEAGQEEVMGAITDITERKQAAESLRASEHLARGQLEALTTTLSALAHETDADKMLEHVVCIIVKRLGAHSIGVWEINEKTGRMEPVGTSEGERLRLSDKAERETSPPEINYWREHPVWSEFFRSGSYCVQSTIEAGGSKVRILAESDTAWHDCLGNVVDNPNAPSSIKHLPDMGVSAALSVPMFVAGKVTGFLSIRFRQWHEFRREEIELTRALAHQVMLAIQLTHLTAQSRESAILEERTRLARDIHDTLAQGFTGIIMQLEAAKGATLQGAIAETAKHIELAGELARLSLAEARRSVRALRPRSLRDGTLCVALNDLLKRMSDGTDLRAEIQIQGDERTMPAEWEEDLLRIAQESLTNTIKHAKARNFRATLSFGANEIQLQLADDGRGCDLQADHEGFGLIGMRERVDRMRGRFILRSKPGEGTEIIVTLNHSTIPKSRNQNEQA